LNRQNAEKIITEYLKPIYGFARKRCNNMQDAEDLSHDIVLKAFKAFLIKDDIADPASLSGQLLTMPSASICVKSKSMSFSLYFTQTVGSCSIT